MRGHTDALAGERNRGTQWTRDLHVPFIRSGTSKRKTLRHQQSAICRIWRRPSLNPEGGNSKYQRLLCPSTQRNIPDDLSSSDILKPRNRKKPLGVAGNRNPIPRSSSSSSTHYIDWAIRTASWDVAQSNQYKQKPSKGRNIQTRVMYDQLQPNPIITVYTTPRV